MESPLIDSLIKIVEDNAPGTAADTVHFHPISRIFFLQDSLDDKLNRGEYSPFDTTYIYEVTDSLADDIAAIGDSNYVLTSETTNWDKTTTDDIEWGDTTSTIATQYDLTFKSDTGHTHTESEITDLDHTDTDAIHLNVADEYDGVDQKTPVALDLVLIEDSENSYVKKYFEFGDMPISTATEIITDSLAEDIATKTTLATVYPVGCIYIETTGTNPATTFGFGTWVAFGAGKVLVGLNSSDADFDTAEETGGSKTHTHAAPTIATTRNLTGQNTALSQTSAAGSSVQPYIVVYFWKRTA